MTDTPKVIVVHGDPRAADGVRLGFEREGLAVVAGDVDEVLPSLEHAAVVVAGATAADAAKDLLLKLVAAGATRGAPPVLYVGNGVSRDQALAAGATAALVGPAFVRDVVTIGRILAGRRPGNRSVMDGDLGDSFGVFYLVRALAAIGATGTLLMMRGLRRGEIRFFEGEVTSAQVGGLHGQGALHQLLLWTEARFELRYEPVVRRQQIPITSDELLASAERFLIDLRAASGVLSPASVYEHDGGVMQQHARSIPTEVHGVLRLFDGHRTVADALEDSPYRVFETLRIAERAAQVGILRRRESTRARSPHRAMLALEEWLVGGAGVVATPIVREGSGDIGGGKGKGKGKKPKPTEPRGHAVVEVDWKALVPRTIGMDTGALSPVVPSSIIAGEISVRPSRGESREKLEALTDAGERDRLFPGTSISVDLSTLEAEARAEVKAEADAKVKAAEEAKAKADADAKAKADAEAKAKADADAKAKAEADAKAKAEADAKAKAEADAKAKAEADAKAKAEADAKAKADADAKAKAEAEAKAKADADADAKAKAEAEAKAKADADTKAKAEADAKAKADADAKAKADAEAKAESEANAKDSASSSVASGELGKSKRERRASGEIPSKDSAAAPSVLAGPSILVDELEQAASDAQSLTAAATRASEASTSQSSTSGELKSKDATSGELKSKDATSGELKSKDATSSDAKKDSKSSDAKKDSKSSGGKKDSKSSDAKKDSKSSDAKKDDKASDAKPSVDQLRADASKAAAAITSSFSDDEEAFFRAGQEPTSGAPAESFSDLDDGYQPQSFWDRVLGRKPKPLPRRPRK